jgi:hypothetical protein
MSANNNENIRVFISYSHDSPQHIDCVWKLSDRLRSHGIDCIIDQYEFSPREGWPRWSMNQIEDSRFVLVVCTEIYHRRVRGKEEPGKGLGAKWEGAIITQELYDSEANNDKFIPVLFSTEDSAHIPVYLRGATRYILDDDYDNLYRHLTNQPKRVKPALGERRSMPLLARKEDFQQPGIFRIKAIIAGFALFVLVLLGWFSPFAPVKPDEPKPPESFSVPSSYLVRVTVLDLQQMPVNDADVQPSVSSELKKVVGGWEITIPAASKPADGKVTVYASKLGASLFGQEDLVLDKDPNYSIKIQLRKGEPPIREGAPPNPQNSGGSPGKPTPSSPISIYRVRVTVLDLEQALVEEAEIHSLPSGEVKKVSGGWEIDIPAQNKPVDGKLTIYASKPSAFLKAQVSLQLGKDPNPTVEIHLRREASARVTGWVQDSSSQGIAGALVYACDHRAEAVRTGPDGKFDLMAHKATGQIVIMCAEKEGYILHRQSVYAGRSSVVIILQKER